MPAFYARAKFHNFAFARRQRRKFPHSFRRRATDWHFPRRRSPILRGQGATDRFLGKNGLMNSHASDIHRYRAPTKYHIYGIG